jgi:MFS family permease
LWFVQKSNNVNELRTVIIVIVYIFRRIFLTVMLFLARGIIAGVFQAAYVYTPEVYPTSLRAVGVGSCSAMARLGAMVTPYVAQVLLKSSISFATTIYTVAAILAAVACLILPFETTGKELTENVQQHANANVRTNSTN